MNGLLSEVQNQYPREQLHCLSDDHDVEVPAVGLSELKVSLSAVSVSEVGYIYIYMSGTGVSEVVPTCTEMLHLHWLGWTTPKKTSVRHFTIHPTNVREHNDTVSKQAMAANSKTKTVTPATKVSFLKLWMCW